MQKQLYHSQYTRKLVINHYGRWVEQLVQEGWNAYLVTFMFKPIPGSRITKIQEMQREIERAYARSLTRVLRNPNSRGNRNKRPIWIAAPDLPVIKKRKKSKLDAFVNDGLHYHALGVYHPDNRWQGAMPELLELNLPRESWLDRVDVESLSRTHHYATGYALKALGQRSDLSLDHLLLLPRTSSEM